MPVERAGKLNGIEARLENATKLSLLEWGMLVAQHATGKAPVLSGRLKRSISNGMPFQVARFFWKTMIGSNVEYAAIQELGGEIPPHEITPTSKQALAFEWPNAPAGVQPGSSGLYVFKRVMHPGAKIPAQPYLRPALKETKRTGLDILKKNILAAFRNG